MFFKTIEFFEEIVLFIFLMCLAMIHKVRSETDVSMQQASSVRCVQCLSSMERRSPTCVVLMNSHFRGGVVRCIRVFILVLSVSVLFFALEQLLFVLSKLRWRLCFPKSCVCPWSCPGHLSWAFFVNSDPKVIKKYLWISKCSKNCAENDPASWALNSLRTVAAAQPGGPGAVCCDSQAGSASQWSVPSAQACYSLPGAVKWWWCLKSKGSKSTIYWTLPTCCALSRNYIILFVFTVILGGSFYYPNFTDGELMSNLWKVTRCVTNGASLSDYFEQVRD